jgi:hypothetical protein
MNTFDSADAAYHAMRNEWEPTFIPELSTQFIMLTYPGTEAKTSNMSIDSPKTLFTKGDSDWYFVCVWYSISRTIKVFHYLSYESIVYHNNDENDSWVVPLFMCQRKEALTKPTPFSHYSHDSYSIPMDRSLDSIISDLENAFETRFKLMRWMSMPHTAQRRHQLSEKEINFASPSLHEKVLDNICYYMTARDITADLVLYWIGGEVNLHTHKHLLRPDLNHSFAAVLPSEIASNHHSIRNYHKYNILRVKRLEWDLFHIDSFKPLVTSFIDKMREDMQKKKEDAEYQE